MLLESGHFNGVFRIWVVTPKKSIEHKVTIVGGVVVKMKERELSVTNTDPSKRLWKERDARGM
jgi:vacuolar-type H+-ATPase subunit E/Vma4